MGKEELILKKLNEMHQDVKEVKADIFVLTEKIDRLEERVSRLEQDNANIRQELVSIRQEVADFKQEFWDFREETRNKFIAIDKRFEQIDARFESMDKRFEEMENKFIEAQGEREYLFKEVGTVRRIVTVLQTDMQENKLQIHAIFSIVGAHYDVPRLTDRLYAVERTVGRHNEQIQTLNQTVGIAE